MTEGRPPIDPRTGRPRQPPRKPRDQHQQSRRVVASRTPPPGGRPRPAKPSRPVGSQRPAPQRAALPPHKPPTPPEPRAATLKMGSPRRRLRLTMFALLFAFSLFAGRLFQLQAVDAGGYAKAAEVSRESTATLYAKRGDILAADGTPLASSVEAYDVVADPTQVAKYHEDIDELASKLAGVLSTAPEFAGSSPESAGIDVATLTKKLSDAKNHYAVLAKKVSPQTWATIAALSASNTFNAKKTVGLDRNRDDRRVYPGGSLASNLVGYTSGDGVGKGGIEQMLNSKLMGVDGKMSYQAASGIEIPTAGVNLKPAVDGSSVRTTIDPYIQWEAEKAIAGQVTATGAASGTAVVEDVATGKILAVATAPTFDPSHITQADVPNLGNRAFTDVYEPGSVLKVVTMAGAIQEGVATPATQIPPFTGSIFRGGKTLNDDVPHAAWNLTLAGVLARSSNVGTILLSDMFDEHGLPRDATIYKYQRLFGLGSKTDVDFPGESTGIVVPPNKWSASQRYTVTYGQGISVTAMQVASVYQTIANGGVRIEPSLIQSSTDPSGKTTSAPDGARTQVVSASTASQVAQMLEAVVASPLHDGTGEPGAIPGYRVAAKTGTANKFDAKTGGYLGYTASFVGFAPADKPQIVVSVELQDPKTNGEHFGGQVAAPVFKDVMEFALRSRGIAPTPPATAILPTTY